MSRSGAAYPALAIAVIVAIFAVSLWLRADSLKEKTGAQGLEATYHVLWTARALSYSKPSSHHYLPTVTRDPSLGNSVPWGATVATPGGSYVYTSFPPLGFLLPAWAMNLNATGADFFSLALLNSLIGLAAALGLAILTRAAVLATTKETERDGRTGWIVFGLVGAIYLLLREALVSHGAVYWPHSIAQLCLIAGSWAAFGLFCGRCSFQKLMALGLACLIYPSLEWTGFVFNVGVFLAFGFMIFSTRAGGSFVPVSRRTLIVALAIVAMVTLAAGITILAQFFAAIGSERMLEALGGRASARGLQPLAIIGLPVGYFVSFGALFPLGIFALYWAMKRKLFVDNRAVWLLVFIASFPVLENAIMMQHAYEFSFDRLKLAVPLLLIGSLVLVAENLIRRFVVVSGVVSLIVVSNLAIFLHESLYYKPWGDAVASNRAIYAEFVADRAAHCAVYGSVGDVRGYLNLLFDRDIRASTDAHDLATHAIPGRDCGLVLIHQQNVFTDLPKVTEIGVYDLDAHLLRTYRP